MYKFTDFLTRKFLPEGVRMGAKDIGSYTPKKDFTIGFEFEIAVDGAGRAYVDDWEEFSNHWYANTDMSPVSFWNENNTSREILEIINSYKLKPAFGKPDIPEDDERYDDSMFFVLNAENETIDIRDIEDPEEFFDLFAPNRHDRWLDAYYYEAENETMQMDFEEWSRNNRNDSPNATAIIKDIFEDELGVDINEFGSYHETSKNNRKWYTEPDSSISPAGAELVSPVMPLARGMETLKRVFEIIDDRDELSTNSSTGLHINIGDFSTQEANSIDLLKFSLIVGENYVLSEFGRANNNYATSNIAQLVANLRGENGAGDYKQIISSLNKTILGSNKRESFANFKKLYSHGFIEVRAPGGKDYHTKYNEISNTVNRLVRTLEIAMDPTAHREEYLSKLYKLVNYDTSKDKNLDTKNRTDAALNSKINGLVQNLRKLIGYEISINTHDINLLFRSYINIFQTLTVNGVKPQEVNPYLITMREIFTKVKGKNFSSEDAKGLRQVLQHAGISENRYKQFLNSLLI